jgi:hypothetical protein
MPFIPGLLGGAFWHGLVKRYPAIASFWKRRGHKEPPGAVKLKNLLKFNELDSYAFTHYISITKSNFEVLIILNRIHAESTRNDPKQNGSKSIGGCVSTTPAQHSLIPFHSSRK